MLRLKGRFPGQPVRIDFELLFQAVGGRWRVFGLSVQPVATAPAAAPVKAPDKTADKSPTAKTKAPPAKK